MQHCFHYISENEEKAFHEYDENHTICNFYDIMKTVCDNVLSSLITIATILFIQGVPEIFGRGHCLRKKKFSYMQTDIFILSKAIK